jgi:hypothetical protein
MIAEYIGRVDKRANVRIEPATKFIGTHIKHRNSSAFENPHGAMPRNESARKQIFAIGEKIATNASSIIGSRTAPKAPIKIRERTNAMTR